MEAYEDSIIQDDYDQAYKSRVAPNFDEEEELESDKDFINAPSPVTATR